MRVELLSDQYLTNLEDSINEKIKHIESSGDYVRNIDVEVKPEDNEDVTRYIAVLYVKERTK